MGSLIGAISSQKVTFSVALLAGDGEDRIWLFAGTSENPALRGAVTKVTAPVKMCRVRTISRKDQEPVLLESSETIRQTPHVNYEVMI